MSPSLDGTCPHIPGSLNLKRRGWGSQEGGTGGLAWPALCYLTAPPDHRPDALVPMLEPLPTALEQAAPLGFLGTRAPRGGPAAREHPSVADVSSQVSLSWGCTGCMCLVGGVPSSVRLCDTEVTSLPGTPALTHSWRKLQGQCSCCRRPHSLQAMVCAHRDTTHPSPQAPGKDCVHPGPQPGHTPGFRHDCPVFPNLTPEKPLYPSGMVSVLPVGQGVS